MTHGVSIYHASLLFSLRGDVEIISAGVELDAIDELDPEFCALSIPINKFNYKLIDSLAGKVY
jgi:hypothetical protein